MNRLPLLVNAATALLAFAATSAPAQDGAAASGSLLASSKPDSSAAPAAAREDGHALRAVSMFAVAPAEARVFHEHDLIQIIVRESTAAKSEHTLETEKSTTLAADVGQFPDLQLSNVLEGVIKAGDTSELPQLDVEFENEFEGDGEYERRDDFTARLSAEVVQVLPNGNLVLESRTRMKNDEEAFTLTVTGICRPEDVTSVNTVLSNQLHDLKVEKIHTGELKKANEKGILTKVLEAIFAF